MHQHPLSSKVVIYHLSFILIFLILFFIGAFQLFIYEDRWDGTSSQPMWSWASMNTSEKIGAVSFYTSQFPFGLLFGLLTGNYGNFVFACLLNPLSMSFLLRKIRKYKPSHISKTIMINLIFLILIFILAFAGL